ncbi:beta-propeller domain-containing protein [Pseudorhodoferax sp.]|uniref:beta-propeller domain-containing protein n=1 Tax=Pseudorhodoferax sp. TaxID=1993553 RepID=UPI002DD6B0F5|nr:beta-propeller domain-containing protein [Pseudorhodoferax sp.]
MFPRLLHIAGLALLLAACTSPGATPEPTPPGTRTLAAYGSEAELARALGRWQEEALKLQQRQRREAMAVAKSMGAPTLAAPAPAAAAAPAPAAEASTAAADGITNVQTAGVDEGGIVKRAGEHLVVLRRGRLFTLRVAGDALQPVAQLDAYAPGSDPRGAWYDELLVSGSTVVVVGYSYNRGGTEIGLFDIDAGGQLAYRATYHLRSYDYYSARNYASRLVGRQLVFYSPMLLRASDAPLAQQPGLRRWAGQPDDASWQRILPATRIYRSDDDFDPRQPLALHTVTRCLLGEPTLRCESTAVLGPAGRVFHVSQSSVYVWVNSRGRGQAEAQSVLFRLPLDGSAPTGIKTVGVPIDQMSFLEDGQGHINVLLRAAGAGEGMWGAGTLQGATALLRLPLAALGDGRGAAERGHYRLLPAQWTLHNRFVGDWLLLGSVRQGRRPAADGREAAMQPAAWAVRYAEPALAAQPLDPGHGVERIEALGGHAVLVGNAGSDLHFSAVRLQPGSATLAGRHVQPGARQGESRSHGFFYRPTGPAEGLLGLPVLEGPGRAGSAVYRGTHGAASVLFLRERGLDFRPLGALASGPAGGDDGCKASCVDWYGNARPLFIGERVFALLGYELVEGRLDAAGGAERLSEHRRVSFAPRPPAPAGGRGSPFQ